MIVIFLWSIRVKYLKSFPKYFPPLALDLLSVGNVFEN